MNARAIKKILMKSRFRVLWGDRAFITIRMPMEVIESPFKSAALEYLKFKKQILADGYEEVFDGFFSKSESIGESAILFSGFSGVDRGEQIEQNGIIYYREEKFDNGYAKYYCGHKSFYENNQTKTPKTLENFDKKISDLYVNYTNFISRLYESEIGAACQYNNKTSYFQYSKDLKYIYVTYSIKWFYHDRKFSACSALSQFVKQRKYCKVLRKNLNSIDVI